VQRFSESASETLLMLKRGNRIRHTSSDVEQMSAVRKLPRRMQPLLNVHLDRYSGREDAAQRSNVGRHRHARRVLFSQSRSTITGSRRRHCKSYQLRYFITGFLTLPMPIMDDNTRLTTKIRLRQLRCFVTVARKKSFVLASEELGLTQPAVSRSIKELELILGEPLFDRGTRGAILTDKGVGFLDASEAAILQINQGLQSFFGGEGRSEKVRIGALPNVCSQLLPGLIHEFKAIHPNTDVTIFPGTNASLLDGLRRAETDFVIGRLSSSEDMRGLSFEALFDEPLVFVARRGHPATTGSASLEDLQRFPLMLPPEGTIIRQELDRYLAGNGLAKPQNLIESTSSDFQRAYLQGSDCIAAIPKGVIQSDLDQGTLVKLSIGDGELKGPVGLTTNPMLVPSGAVVEILNQIRRR